MNEAIERRVEQFVQEILGLVEQLSIERRTAALGAVATILSETGQKRKAKGALASPPRAGSKGPGKVAPPSKRQAPPRRASRTNPAARADAHETVAPAPSLPSNEVHEEAKREADAAPPADIPTDRARAWGEQGSPANAREARVLDAVRSLGRATAADVAGLTGQPNGSVAVALRGLVARGLIARTERGRGTAYCLPSQTLEEPSEGSGDEDTGDDAGAAPEREVSYDEPYRGRSTSFLT